MKNTVFQYFVIVALSLIDAIFTFMMLHQGGKEINPVIALMIDIFGPIEGLLYVKIPSLFLIGAIVYLYNRAKWVQSDIYLQKRFPVLMNWVIALYFAVVTYTLIFLHI